MLLNQEQLEARMIETGYNKTIEGLNESERHGSADRNPYAATVYRDFVQPLAALVQEAQNTKGARALAAHVALLRPLDPWTVAFVAVRCALNALLTHDKKNGDNLRSIGYAVGKAIHSELYLAQFSELAPDLFFIINEDLGRRKAKNTDHKLATFKAQAAAKGMNFVEWPVGARDQVGMWLMGQLHAIGMVEIGKTLETRGKRNPTPVKLAEHVEEMINNVREHFALSRPMNGPCVEQPRPWLSWTDGGWHTNGMRRVLPHPVKASACVRELLATHDMPNVLRCLNVLQATRWKINEPILRVIEQIAKIRNIGEIVMADPESKPAPLEWFATIGDNPRTPEQEQELTEWKAAMTSYHTRVKIQRVARNRLGVAIRTANEYAQYDNIYFVHFCDSRGRVYPMSQGVSPQGSDVQKGLIHFAEGLPLDNERAVFWFLVHGANKWGYDKEKLQKRAEWHKDKVQLLLSFADDPINNQGWLDADNPFQFLAWCMEFAEWHRTGNVHSRLPVSLDGSCSGLQHFSAMLRDEVGGKATNLIPSPEMQDIYRLVAEAATVRMRLMEDDARGFRQAWLAHGINRSVTKRPVMTTPYGITKRSAIRYVINDYLCKQTFIPAKAHWPAAAYLMDAVWPAIGDVVVKSREGMRWLEQSASRIIADNADSDGAITWVTPSGFLASQSYYKYEEHRIATKLHGHARIKVMSETTEANRDEHAAGMAPNFVHSMDGSHLHLTTCAMDDRVPGVALAMIHDDFGTHAAHTQLLFDTLREQFVSMYANTDPLEALANKYNLPAPPSKGKLNLEDIKQSEFAFS